MPCNRNHACHLLGEVRRSTVDDLLVICFAWKGEVDLLARPSEEGEGHEGVSQV